MASSPEIRHTRRSGHPWRAGLVVALFAGAPLAVLLTACGAETRPDRPTEGETAPPPVEAPQGPPPAFEDYPSVPLPNLRPAAVNLGSHPRAREFRTALARGAAQGPNFAGHLTVVTWGCGTMCQQLMVVDGRSGRVLADVEGLLGFEHRLDSRLLVANPPGAVAENPCPACRTVYYVWDEEAGLLEIPPQAWRGTTPLPHAARPLVARVRAEEAPSLAGEAGGAVRVSWDRLAMIARDGSRIDLADEVRDGELLWVHRLAGWIPALDAWVVERRWIPEGVEFLLVEAGSGRRTSLDAVPVPSPSGGRFVTASLDLVAGHASNRIRVYRHGAGGPTLEWEVEPRGWGASAPRWLAEDRIRLDRGVVDWNDHELVTRPMVLRREAGGWTTEFSEAHAEQALLTFFSALGQGLWVEATHHWGGSWDVLRGWNPELDPEDLSGLWRAGCERNGLVCLGRVEVVETRPHDGGVELHVRFRTRGGEVFVRGACCGATEAEMPSESVLPYTVRRVGEAYLVQNLPVYVP